MSWYNRSQGREEWHTDNFININWKIAESFFRTLLSDTASQSFMPFLCMMLHLAFHYPNDWPASPIPPLLSDSLCGSVLSCNNGWERLRQLVAKVKSYALVKSVPWHFRAEDYLNNLFIQVPHLRDETKSQTFIDLPKAINRAKIILELESTS